MVKILRVNENFDHRFFGGSSCAFGVFDGVHRGHRFLLSCAQESAAKSGGSSIALTFDIDPDEMFHPARLKKLMSNEARIAMLAESGVDAVVVLPFTQDFSVLGPLEFLAKTFNGYAPESLHVGYDFRFGAKASGTVKELDAWSEGLGTTICAHELQGSDGAPISSTRIRHLLSETDISTANELLARPYFIDGQVQRGRGEGVNLGFRTANLQLESMMQVLGEGVYAAYVTVEDRRYKAAVSVGVSPVFEEKTTATCEAHILDFEGDLYGKTIRVEFTDFLRPMIKFESIEQLSETVLGNIAWVRENL